MQEIIFANSDKNLGPVAVTLERYIQDALVHLTDRSTYEFISAKEAQKRNQALHSEIFEWTVKFRKEVGDDTVAYLRVKLKDSKKEPFSFSTSCANFTKLLYSFDRTLQSLQT